MNTSDDARNDPEDRDRYADAPVGTDPPTDKTVVMASDRGEVSWTPVTEKHAHEKFAGQTDDTVRAGGYIFGPTELVAEVRSVLSDQGPELVHISHHYPFEFSAGRDELADVVAALYSTGRGRGVLNDAGWHVLNYYRPDMDDYMYPAGNDPSVVY